MSYVVTVDTGACAGHGDCAVVAPDVFHVGEVAEVIGTAPADTLIDAAAACPAAAITVIDQDTGEQIYP
jgi:ferredoxin